ncbi:unnamed protein product [Acanthoscelides obtectus]|uniref:NFX1-type zinc finger-containing protein 1 n=1 Tax=Acanthoscelides obtectus TaxID=200917 RepID=A0A9P0L126_ACAOB|nr:unnamed protein product [Acanthoscelides obtectus]CAK1666262.1 NFX1-type zinc finger-containing protein 1 [Acanthoscelides obtectus]
MKTNNWKQTSHYNSRTLQGHLSHLSLLDYNTDLLEINDQDIYPARSELFAKSRPSIAPNKIKGPYSSVENYLKIQYDLLREDFIGPLRQDLAALCKDRDTVQNIYFHNVKFLRKGIKQDSTCHCVKILSKLDKEVVASDSKRLITGSFLLFYYKDLHTAICGKVEDNDLSKSQRLIVSLHPDTYMYLNKVYTMIEYSVLFEPYYNALRALKGMSDYTFPMERYIVNLNLSVNRPSYLVGITRNVYERNLNKYQLAAWQNAVNKEFVLIQGPPGTGKTFLALKIVKDLIINCNRESPILIVTYKNHALDTFLEGLCDTTKDIIRLGGQSKNRKMAELSIKNQRIQQRERGFTGNSAFAVNKLYKSYISAEQKLKSFGAHLDMVLTGEAIVQFSTLDESLPKFCPHMWEDVGFNHEKRIMWLLQSNDHGEDFELLEKAASLLQLLHKSGGWLFTMSSIKSICKDIEDLINCKDVEMPLSVQCDEKLCELSNKKLKKLKELFLKQISKIKNYMTSDLPKIDISNMTDLVTNPFNIPVRGRWQLYREWIDKYAARYHENIDKAIVECKEAYKDFDRASLPDNVELMKRMKVIGMTTTCAARMRSTLELLKCPIIVVEEAAEVLEAHVVSVVTKHCKHLILIGDHQQLRPSVADYEIDTKYNLGVSLFERMVMNGVECHTLNVQHRMRPEISRLIVPAIYPNLKDHESVTKYPDVRGIDGNAFFLDHNELEEDALEQSKKNTHEARFLISLAQYLLMNGYQPEEITILSGYLGQVKTLDKERRLCSHEGMKKIAIKSVDDYQVFFFYCTVYYFQSKSTYTGWPIYN